MEKAVNRKFTDEFKEGAVKLFTDKRYKLSEAARNLGIHATQLRRWIKGKLPAASPALASIPQLQNPQYPFSANSRNVYFQLRRNKTSKHHCAITATFQAQVKEFLPLPHHKIQ